MNEVENDTTQRTQNPNGIPICIMCYRVRGTINYKRYQNVTHLVSGLKVLL